MSIHVCKTRLLTLDQATRATRRGVEINPSNAIADEMPMQASAGRRGGQRRLALVTARRWPVTGVDLTVQFLDSASTALRKRLLLHMNAWGLHANVRFRETGGIGMVRVARLNHPPDDAGFWSYIGTDILGIEDDLPTMNLDSFTMRTPEAEFLRVVRHEAGHTLGFEHEHMRADLVKLIDRKKAFGYYRKTDGWTVKDTEAQVLTPLKARSLMGTAESDPLSIMCYQIPGEITKDGNAIAGGIDISDIDHAFAAKVYPKDLPGRGLIAPDEPMTLKPLNPSAHSVGFVTPDDALQIVVLDGFDAATGASGAAFGQANFARVFASYGGARVMQAMRLRAEPGQPSTRFGKIIRVHERIKSYTNRDSGTLPDDKQMIEFGEDLFESLFQGEVRRLYDEARSRQQGRKLDVILTSMIPWIGEKPWEFSYDRTRNSFLATEEVHFIRNALAAVPAERIAPKQGPLRILVAAAQPVGFGRLSVEQEENVIRRGFAQLAAAGLVELVPLARATPGSLLSSVSNGHFDIVHFIGHGAFNEETGIGSLIFEDGSGQSVEVPERALREILCGRGIRLIFLNACQTGSGGKADFNKGVAQALVSHGVPALVANQYSVLDSSATSFAQHFYWALAQGMGIGQAAREARIAVNCWMQGDVIDWAVPVVYARDPSMTLCDRPTEATVSPVAATQTCSRRHQSQHLRRIAVWDIDNVFPMLEETLRGMNGAQSMFGFEVVDLSTPLDVWDLDDRGQDGTPHLIPEKLAARMANAAIELGIDLLVSVTRHPISGNRTSWWPIDRRPSVAVVSLSDLDEVLAAGAQIDRALANRMVAVLAGFTAQMESHAQGSNECPMWHNPRRRSPRITDQQHFDAACHSKLKKEYPRELEAFEALLKSFS